VGWRAVRGDRPAGFFWLFWWWGSYATPDRHPRVSAEELA
jgi:hypothetical protein